MFCRNCGIVLDIPVNTCPYCGALVHTPVNTPPKKKSSALPGLGYLLGLLFAPLGIILGIYMLSNQDTSRHGLRVICWSLFWMVAGLFISGFIHR